LRPRPDGTRQRDGLDPLHPHRRHHPRAMAAATKVGVLRMSALLTRRVLAIPRYAVMIALAVCSLLPLIWMISSSLKPEAEVLTIPPEFVPSTFRWENYSQIFDRVGIFLFNSVKLAIYIVAGVLHVASLAGYAFARLDFPGRNI